MKDIVYFPKTAFIMITQTVTCKCTQLIDKAFALSETRSTIITIWTSLKPLPCVLCKEFIVKYLQVYCGSSHTVVNRVLQECHMAYTYKIKSPDRTVVCYLGVWVDQMYMLAVFTLLRFCTWEWCRSWKVYCGCPSVCHRSFLCCNFHINKSVTVASTVAIKTTLNVWLWDSSRRKHELVAGGVRLRVGLLGLLWSKL